MVVTRAICALYSWTGEVPRLISLRLGRLIPPPPAIAVGIDVSGAVRGLVTWAFSNDLARTVARSMLSTDEAPRRTVIEAVAELVRAGQDGPEASPAPVVIYDVTTPRMLDDDVLVATIECVSGTVEIFLALHAAVSEN